MGVLLKSAMGLGTVYALMFAPVVDHAALGPAASLCAQAATAKAHGDASFAGAGAGRAMRDGARRDRRAAAADAGRIAETRAAARRRAALGRPDRRRSRRTLVRPGHAVEKIAAPRIAARRRDGLFETGTPEAALRTLDAIREDFAFLDDWEDRYRYVIELGRELEAFPESARTDANKVRGCVSQVWIEDHVEDGVLRLKGDSDSHLVRGLVAIATTLYDGKTPQQALAVDARGVFTELGLEAHLTPQRSNGVRAMIDRIKSDAAAFAAA